MFHEFKISLSHIKCIISHCDDDWNFLATVTAFDQSSDINLMAGSLLQFQTNFHQTKLKNELPKAAMAFHKLLFFFFCFFVSFSATVLRREITVMCRPY